MREIGEMSLNIIFKNFILEKLKDNFKYLELNVHNKS